MNNLWEIDQAFTWIKNKHEIKVGGNFMSTRFAFLSPAHPNGTMSFTGAYTQDWGWPIFYTECQSLRSSTSPNFSVSSDFVPLSISRIAIA